MLIEMMMCPLILEMKDKEGDLTEKEADNLATQVVADDPAATIENFRDAAAMIKSNVEQAIKLFEYNEEETKFIRQFFNRMAALVLQKAMDRNKTQLN